MHSNSKCMENLQLYIVFQSISRISRWYTSRMTMKQRMSHNVQVTRIPVSWLGSKQISLFLKRMTICTKISLKNLFGRRRRGSGPFVTGNLPLAVCCSFIHLLVNDSTCAHFSQSLKVQRIGM